jgi:hypothetical protein
MELLEQFKTLREAWRKAFEDGKLTLGEAVALMKLFGQLAQEGAELLETIFGAETLAASNLKGKTLAELRAEA